MVLAATLVLAWCFVMGACVGSFLNVVAWRVPRGKSLVHPPSHCPMCRTPILLRDNVPVLGWMLVRGRCRACGVRISPRYPAIEFLLGAAFAVLAYVDLLLGGPQLPLRQFGPPVVPSLPFDWLLVGIWMNHVVLVALLAAIALLEYEGSRPGWKFVVMTLLVGFVPPIAWPEMRPILPRSGASHYMLALHAVEVGTQGLLIGLATGTCLGWSNAPRKADRCHVVCLALALGTSGMLLGIDVVVPVIGVVATAMLVLRGLSLFWGAGHRLPSLLVAVATFVRLLFPFAGSRGATRSEFWLAEAIGARILVVMAVVAVSVILLAGNPEVWKPADD